MLSVISQLRLRISLHSLIMLLTPPLWCVHFFFSSYCAPGKSIEKQPLSQLQHSYVPVPLKMYDFFFFYLQFTLNCLFNEGRSICLIVSCFFFFNSVKLTRLVKEHLGVFLRGARNLKPEPSHVKEVCFLCVQCMEVCKLKLILCYEVRVVQLELN